MTTEPDKDVELLALFVKGAMALHPNLDPDDDALEALASLESQNQTLQERIDELVKWAWQFGEDGCPSRDQHLSDCPVYKAVFRTALSPTQETDPSPPQDVIDARTQETDPDAQTK